MQPEVVVTAGAMDRSGAAVAQAGDQRLLIHGAIAGERVRVRRGRSVGHGTLAELVEVLEPSPFRVVPRCRHAAVCGGCTWQHVAYPEQLRMKTRSLEAVLRRAMGSAAPRVLPMVGTPVGEDGMPWAFRQKAAFVFAPDGDGGLGMGHFARGSHDVVPVVECPVHPARANRIAFALRDELRRAGVPAAGEGLRGLARHVLVRTSRDEREAIALLIATRREPLLEAPLGALLARPERPDGLSVNLHDRPGPYLLGRETQRVAGAGHVREESIGPTFLVSATAFFQTNVAAAATLVRVVSEALPSEPVRVLDLYSGGGLFALALARRGHTVTAVEGSRKSVRDAELNRRINNVPEARLRLVAAAVEEALPHLEPGGWDASAAVLDGVFGRLRPRRAALVSCNPEALARELPPALAAGYRVLRVQPVDMFPHTPHVEAVAVLERDERFTRSRPISRSRTRGSRTLPARGHTPTA
jgi:23S rRNA (uracil1939-C5)-methyltransferase